MKYCPNCRTEYADESLQFCLQDGTPLVDASNQNLPNVSETEMETLVVPRRVEPIRFEPPSSYQTNQPNWEPSQPAIVERAAKKSNTTAIVLLSVLGTILLLGLGGLGAWFYSNNKKTEVAANINAAPPNRSINSNAANNQNANASINANRAAPSPTAAPTVKPTLKSEEAQNVVTAVEYTIDDWEAATENLELDRNLENYADTVDYYRAGRVGIGKVRADKERAYGAFDSININISNMKITPDASGEKAVALFDKEWTFEGEGKFSSGKVQQQLTLGKIGGKWLITGEKDLKVYYTRN